MRKLLSVSLATGAESDRDRRKNEKLVSDKALIPTKSPSILDTGRSSLSREKSHDINTVSNFNSRPGSPKVEYNKTNTINATHNSNVS